MITAERPLVIFVDSDPVALQLYASHHARNFTVRTFSSTGDLLRANEQTGTDETLLESAAALVCSLPGDGAEEFIRNEVRTGNPHLAAIILTMDAMYLQEKAYACGAFRVLLKRDIFAKLDSLIAEAVKHTIQMTEQAETRHKAVELTAEMQTVHADLQEMEMKNNSLLGTLHDASHMLRRMKALVARIRPDMPPTELVGDIRMIETEVEHMTSIVSAHLVERRKERAGESACSLLQTLEEEVKRFQSDPELVSKEIAINLLINTTTPKDAYLLAVPTINLRRVISNLLGNAIKYAGAHQTIRVIAEHPQTKRMFDPATLSQAKWIEIPSLSVPVPPPYGTFLITDEGPGLVPEEHLPSRFSAAAMAVTKPKGNGLGLPIVAEMVKSAGGSLMVKTSRGFGSHFMLVFPLAST